MEIFKIVYESVKKNILELLMSLQYIRLCGIERFLYRVLAIRDPSGGS
jgi:hypothetical protein